MKGIVEQYAKGEFNVDRPQVALSETSFELNIEAGTVYEGSFIVSSRNKNKIKGLVYDSRYLLRFETHSFIARSFEVKYTFDATCLDVGQIYRGHINVITDGGEFTIPYVIEIVTPCVRCGNEKIDDLFKFAAFAETNWNEATRLFVSDDFKRTFIDRDPIIKQVYYSLLDSKAVNQVMEEFLVLVHKKRTVTLSVSKAKLDIDMPTELSKYVINIAKNTWGYTFSSISSNAEFIIPAKKEITTQDFVGNVCALEVYISPEHIPEGENSGKIIIENVYQTIEVDVHINKPVKIAQNVESRSKRQLIRKGKNKLTRAYLDYRMDKINLFQYITVSKEALANLLKIEPEVDLYRLGTLHMNILAGETSKYEEEFRRIDADVDGNQMTNQEKCYYNYLKALVIRDPELITKTTNMIRRNYRTDEPKMFYFWLLLFMDGIFVDDKQALYRELKDMYEEGENNPIIYLEFCEILNNNPLILKNISEFEITAIMWGMRKNYISDEVLTEFVKLAGKEKGFNKHIFDVLKNVYDRNEAVLRAEQMRDSDIIDEYNMYDYEDAGKDKKAVSPEAEILANGIREKEIERSNFDPEYLKQKYADASQGISNDEYDEEPEVIRGINDLVRHAERVAQNANKNAEDDESGSEYGFEIDASLYADGIIVGRDKDKDKDDTKKKAEKTERYLKKENENIEVLKSICSMLIGANKLDYKYHKFYKAAVLKSLKFIGLNECYIRSMNMNKYELIPASVLMYLNYKNTLTEDELAYLYANVIYNKSNHMKIYHEYAPTMEDFMESMIVKGKVNDDLTVIYDEFLEPESVSSVFAGKLVNIIFRRKLVCSNKGVRAVIVTHNELHNVQRVNLVNGEAYVEILSENASIIFEDNYGNRYAGSIPYHFERIVDEKAYMSICKEYSPRDYRVLLFNYESIGEFTYKSAKEVNAAREIINCPEISYDFKQQAILNMIEYYHENLDTDVLIKYLGILDIEYLTHSNRRTIITYLIDMNMFDKAFQAVKLYGINELDVKELYRLADYGVQASDGFINEDLMSICVNLYKTGSVSSNIFSYIVSNFNGSITELSEIYKLAKDKVSDVQILAENTLAQMMFTNGYFESVFDIFSTYYNGRSRGLVVKAFLRMAAHNYLIKDDQTPSYIFDAIYSEIVKGNIDDEMSRMALLIYLSRQERYTDEQKNWITDTVWHFMDAGKILPYYKSFSSFIRLPQDVYLKTYLIYKTESPRQVFVKYSFDTGTRNKAFQKVERLNEILPGIYVKEFVVFHGERLVYEIMGDSKGRAIVVESEVLKNKSFNKKDKNRFEMINSMLVKQEMRDDTDLLESLDIYINTVHLFEENLTIL